MDLFDACDFVRGIGNWTPLGEIVRNRCVNVKRRLGQKSCGLLALFWVWFVAVPLIAAPPAGRMVGWGTDYFGQTNLPTGLSNITHVALGWDDEGPWGLALKDDQTFLGWGAGGTNSGQWPDYGQRLVPAGLDNVVAISAGALHCIALRSDGTVVAWGSDFSGLTNTVGLTNLVDVAAGSSHNLGLRADGTVVAWGDNFYGQANVPSDLSNVMDISAGDDFSLALKSDGSVTGWGRNWIGQINIPLGLSNVVRIASGYWHGLALKSDGTVSGWGDNRQGQATPPPGLSNVVAIACGNWHSLALKSDGTVVGWGKNNQGQATPPAGLRNVVAIVGGGLESAAISVDLKVTSLGLSASNALIRFQSFSGQNYLVETSTNLQSATWAAIPGGNIAGNGQEVLVTDTNAAAVSKQRFYRLRLTP